MTVLRRPLCCTGNSGASRQCNMSRDDVSRARIQSEPDPCGTSDPTYFWNCVTRAWNRGYNTPIDYKLQQQTSSSTYTLMMSCSCLRLIPRKQRHVAKFTALVTSAGDEGIIRERRADRGEMRWRAVPASANKTNNAAAPT